MAGLLQQTQGAQLQSSNSADPRSKKKQQCRWCIETFDRKFNKDRYEARKHPVELAAAAADTSALEVAGAARASTSGHKRAAAEISRDDEGEGRPSSESADQSNIPLGQTSSQLKRARSRELESDSLSAAVEATSATEAPMHDDEQPGAASALTVLDPEEVQMEEDLDQLHEALQSGAVRLSYKAAGVDGAACSCLHLNTAT